MANATQDLTTGPVWKLLALMSAPMVLGIMAVISVGLADAYFLGQLGGAPLAAVGYIYPVTMAITSLSIGLSAGANAAVSQAIGRGDAEAAISRTALHAIIFGVGLAAVASALFYTLHAPLFRVMGASDNVMTQISLFIPWWCLSFPFAVLTMLANALFRAHGNARVSATVMTGEAALNIALTPLFIFGGWIIPEMGTAGAALATFLARLTAASLSVVWALRQGLVDLKCDPWKDMGASAIKLAKIGGPAAFSNAINPAGMAAVTAAVATVGEAAVGGFGAATRIQSFVMVPMLAMSSGIGPVVGQNWGADEKARAATALQAAFAFCIGYGIVIGGVLAVFADPLANLLASGGEAADYAATYLRIVGWSLFGYGFIVTANAAMNARDKALWSMCLSLGRILIIYLPAAWLGVTTFGYVGVTLATVTANVLGALAAVWAGWHTGLIRPKTWRDTFK